MWLPVKLIGASLLAFALSTTAGLAQTFEKKNYTYSEWTKGRFSEAVTVTGPAKMIFLAGIGHCARAVQSNGSACAVLHDKRRRAAAIHIHPIPRSQ